MAKQGGIVAVAKRAGVSPAAVSRVLSEDPTFRVTDETREAILAAAHDLSYVSDARARQLRRRTSTVVGVLVRNLNGSLRSGLFSNLSEGLAGMGKDPLVGVHLGDAALARHHINTFRSYRTMAVVMMNSSREIDDEITELLSQGRDACGPAISICLLEPRSEMASVTIDFPALFRTLLDRMMADGRNHVILASRKAPAYPYLRSVFRRIVRETPGISGEYLDADAHDHETLARALAPEIRARARKGRVGVMVTVDTEAIALCHELERLGVSVPGEVAVVGYGNTDYTRLMTPAITSFNIVGLLTDMARRTLELLAEVDAGHMPAARTHAFAPDLVWRDSFRQPAE